MNATIGFFFFSFATTSHTRAILPFFQLTLRVKSTSYHELHRTCIVHLGQYFDVLCASVCAVARWSRFGLCRADGVCRVFSLSPPLPLSLASPAPCPPASRLLLLYASSFRFRFHAAHPPPFGPPSDSSSLLLGKGATRMQERNPNSRRMEKSEAERIPAGAVAKRFYEESKIDEQNSVPATAAGVRRMLHCALRASVHSASSSRVRLLDEQSAGGRRTRMLDHGSQQQRVDGQINHEHEQQQRAAQRQIARALVPF